MSEGRQRKYPHGVLRSQDIKINIFYIRNSSSLKFQSGGEMDESE